MSCPRSLLNKVSSSLVIVTAEEIMVKGGSSPLPRPPTKIEAGQILNVSSANFKLTVK
jgi:hypothetical protein